MGTLSRRGLSGMGISCCIIAHNEGDRIARCIEAVRDIVDEVVVDDSGSTDDTVAVARAAPAPEGRQKVYPGRTVFCRPIRGFDCL